MPNQPDVEKRLIRISIEVYQVYHKLLKIAGGNSAQAAEVIRNILNEYVDDVELTEKERDEIINEIRRNKEKQRRA